MKGSKTEKQNQIALYILHENAAGYSLFLLDEGIGQDVNAVQESVNDFDRFEKVVKFVDFHPFESSQDAVEEQNAVTLYGRMTDKLKNFLERCLPNVKEDKLPNFDLGVSQPDLGESISRKAKIPWRRNELVFEINRGIRLHFDSFIQNLKPGDLVKAQLGLAHSCSRENINFDVNRADNMVIQAISLLDTIDKDVNSLSIRLRDWYSWHFPELAKIITDNYLYAKLAIYIDDKLQLSEDKLDALIKILEDEDKAKEVREAAKASMGQDLSPVDLINVKMFAQRVMNLVEYRKKVYDYLGSKMSDIAPNLAALIGEVVGARLISHVGSLTNLAKCPSSTLQILGAERALFRALKTKGNTPKHGLIFNSSFIGRASARNKGRMARYLAKKCSIASRVDCFSESRATLVGDNLHMQTEEHLEFYEKGIAPRKNIDVTRSAMEKADNQGTEMDTDKAFEPSSKKSKKKKCKNDEANANGKETEVETKSRKKKRARAHEDESNDETKKKKKSKMEDVPALTKSKKKSAK